ncbi:hypothetical protein OPHB3_3091 [Oceanobacillus picturae]|uniref:Uncharacterized protein n=1 Tax=Oceanobacillus picturae TaxID=171693 RepID=A0A0U9HJN1_9BACI|nr:hypothetical protein [Oceanobacillus picturae]GAQ19132.1 hypothetical protein OPHB3_3091 [Oceanobacillus picturae]
MGEITRLTQNDLKKLKTDRGEAIKLIKHYAHQYKGKEHFDRIGASCAMSATNTVDTIIGSSQYLNGKFIMPDEIHVENLVDWFMINRDYEAEKFIVLFYTAHYIKKKINNLYRSINKGQLASTLTLLGNKEAREELEKQIKIRKNSGVKLIRR